MPRLAPDARPRPFRTDALSRGSIAAVAGSALAIGGYAFTITMLVIGFRSGQWPFPGGDVVDFYAGGGNAFRNGDQIYYPGSPISPFYGPPWILAFAALSGLAGAAAIHAVILVLDVVALWVVAGSDWRRLGWLLWCPLVPFDIAAGQLNLPVAAATVAAQRGTTWPLAAMSLAKVWPMFALRPRDWRPFLIAVVVFAAITLPWAWLWPEWIGFLAVRAPQPIGPLIPVPLLARVPVALLLIAIQRPWSRALGALMLSPNLYWGQLVVLIAPVSLWLMRHEFRAEEPARWQLRLALPRPALRLP
jgi:hypothetical protein